MEAALRGISAALRALGDRLMGAWTELTGDGGDGSVLLWVLVGLALLLIVLAALRRRGPRRLAVKPPQLLVTRGEVVPDEVTAPSLSVRRSRERAGDILLSPSGVLSMTVSNLSRYPVQLLEAALRSTPKGAPTVVDLGAVVPAMGSAEVEARLPMALNGDGVMDLYCYAAAPKHKVYRHRVELVWEPWAERFKAAPMEQRAIPVKRLASDEGQARFQMPAPPRSLRAREAEEAGSQGRAPAQDEGEPIAPPSARMPVTEARPPRPPMVRPGGERPVQIDRRPEAETRARPEPPRRADADLRASGRFAPPTRERSGVTEREVDGRPGWTSSAAPSPAYPRPGLVAAKVGPAVLTPLERPAPVPQPDPVPAADPATVPDPDPVPGPDAAPAPDTAAAFEPAQAPAAPAEVSPTSPRPSVPPQEDPVARPEPEASETIPLKGPPPESDDEERPAPRRTRLEFPEDF